MSAASTSERVSPLATASGGDCGRKRTGQSISVRMIVRRQGGGVDGSGKRFIRYHVHFQTKGAFAPYAQYTNLRVVGRLPNGRRYAWSDGTLSKLNRPNARRDYAHTTPTVKPGSTLAFHGRTQYWYPGVPLPDGSRLTADGYRGSCRAR